jgi:hypothetical protein
MEQHERPCAPVDLIGTKRIVAGVTASHIAPASAASLLTQAFAQGGGISRTSCPSAPSSRASEARFAHASMPSRQIEAAAPRPTFPPIVHRCWKPCFSAVLYRAQDRIKRFLERIEHCRRLSPSCSNSNRLAAP